MMADLPLATRFQERDIYQSRNEIELDIMLRTRYSWDIQCELEEKTQSASFYWALHGIREYFYDHT